MGKLKYCKNYQNMTWMNTVRKQGTDRLIFAGCHKPSTCKNGNPRSAIKWSTIKWDMPVWKLVAFASHSKNTENLALWFVVIF